MTHRNAMLARVLRLMALIRQSARTGDGLTDFAQKLGVSTRTIRRDLDALLEAGVAVAHGDAWELVGDCPYCGRRAA